MENQVLDDEMALEEAEPKYAGFWIRVGASLIDVLVYLPFAGFNLYNFYTLKNLPLQIIVTILILLYKPLMEFRYGATVGKMAVKIKVVNQQFGKISLTQAILRYSPWLPSWALSLYSTIILFQNQAFLSTSDMQEVAMIQQQETPVTLTNIFSVLLLITVLVVAFDDKKRGVHDMIAGTFCVYK